MAIIGWILRIIAILIAVRLLLRVIASVTRAARGGSSASSSKMPRTREGGRLVRDPQCGTHLPIDRALSASVGGEQLHFCSDTCRDTWMAARRA